MTDTRPEAEEWHGQTKSSYMRCRRKYGAACAACRTVAWGSSRFAHDVASFAITAGVAATAEHFVLTEEQVRDLIITARAAEVRRRRAEEHAGSLPPAL